MIIILHFGHLAMKFAFFVSEISKLRHFMKRPLKNQLVHMSLQLQLFTMSGRRLNLIELT